MVGKGKSRIVYINFNMSLVSKLPCINVEEKVLLDRTPLSCSTGLSFAHTSPRPLLVLAPMGYVE